MLISTDEKVQREFKEFFIFEPRIKLANAILKRAIELMK